jgi:hypothetical protein
LIVTPSLAASTTGTNSYTGSGPYTYKFTSTGSITF